MPEGEPLIRLDWLLDNLGLFAARTLEHVWLAAMAVGIGFVISFALALLVRRWPLSFAPLTTVAAIIYTIPSLALFALLVPITGRSVLTIQIALVGYTLLVLLRNTVAGLRSVPPEVRESAAAMGFTSLGLLWRVELPLALPIIVAGLRIATVTTIGLLTVAALIAPWGLGFLITDGLRRFFPTLYISAAVLSVALAMIADWALVRLERWATPWAVTRAERS
jgi:osmoprotectant transport system permease protein